MTAPELLAYAAFLFVGVPASLRSWTAAALVCSFLVVHLGWALGGINSVFLDVLCDYAVVSAVFLQIEVRDCSPVGIWGQFRPCWIELPRSDRAVLSLFVPAWAAYFMVGPAAYWIPWACGVLQFIIVGVAAFAAWRKGRRANGSNFRGWSAWRGPPLPFPFAPAMVR